MYYLLFFVPIALNPLKINNRLKGVLNSLALGLTAILRFGAGADYFSYSYIYYLTSNSSVIKLFNTLKDHEIGFKLLMFPFRFLNLPYEVFVAAIAVFIMVLMYFWIQKNSKSVAMSYLVYYSFFFLVWNLSSLRQGLALTIGCFLLFNAKYTWKLRSKLVIIGLLFLLHKSALFYLVFVLADMLKWDKKKLTYLVLASLLVSLLPIANIAIVIAKIPLFVKIASYVNVANAPIGFWDFKSLARLLLIGLVLFHYDSLLKKDAIPKRYLNAYIIGLSFFFFLRFDDLVGARMSIYGYFLAILILPAILELYNYKKAVKLASTVGFIFMCAIYLQKELASMANQAGIPSKGFFVPYISLFQQRSVAFVNNYFYANNYIDILDNDACLLEMNEFGTNLVRKATSIKDMSQYMVAKFPNGFYGLIDTEGHIVLDGRYSAAEYYGGIIRVAADEYYDYRGLALDTQKAALNFFTAKARAKKYIATSLTWFEIDRNSLDSQLYKILEKQGQFKFQNLISQISPLNFYIMEYISYKEGFIYQLYSTDMTRLSPEYFLDTKTILTNRVILAHNVCGTKFYNEDGKMIWMQTK
jgi:hypothetical protein